ncbi:MAG: hypothetical protein LAO18_19350 [Acidobacteriia bacterium]|nr:hypothetical protein [Terriglobia bacterium]
MLSEPQQEQDVIALFHQLVGSGLIKGLHFFGTTSNDRYDSLIEIDYPDTVGFRFNRKTCSLGVGSAIDFPYKSEPKVLEYKYDLDALISDLQKEEKFLKHIDLVVCWTAGGGYSSMLELRPLLVGDNGQERLFYGSTHAAYRVVGGEGSRI